MAGKRVKSQQRGLRSTLNEEERHELGALISAVERLLPEIRPRLEPVFIRTLFAKLVSTGLERMNHSRRMPYLEQWRHLLSTLPDRLAAVSDDQRPAALIRMVEQFQLVSMQGKRKTPGFPESNIRYQDRDGERWFVRVLADGSVEYLWPRNAPRILKRHVDRLLRELPHWKSTDLETAQQRDEIRRIILQIVPDPPSGKKEVLSRKVKAWLGERLQRSQLAYLIGAHCASMNDSPENLPQIYEAVRLADGWLAK